MKLTGMNHFTILARDIDETRRFYTDILGLKEGYRPDMGFPGIWFYVGEQWVLHVVAGRKMPSPPAGVIDHMAFSATGLPETLAKLKANGIDYRLSRQVGTRVWQIFFDDPNGAKVELDFDPEEIAPAA
ncbi:MAG: VOC family protein [Rhodospirillales bacterium]|nr:VOC family protein [Rhodospirillales bacterium]